MLKFWHKKRTLSHRVHLNNIFKNTQYSQIPQGETPFKRSFPVSLYLFCNHTFMAFIIPFVIPRFLKNPQTRINTGFQNGPDGSRTRVKTPLPLDFTGLFKNFYHTYHTFCHTFLILPTNSFAYFIINIFFFSVVFVVIIFCGFKISMSHLRYDYNFFNSGIY